MKSRQSLAVPLVAAVAIIVALTVGYRYADRTQHRRPPAATRGALVWPGTAVISGTLLGYSQRVMTLRTAHGTFGIILAVTADALPTCGRAPTLQSGEALEVRVPVRGDGVLLAEMVRDLTPCMR